MVICSYFLNGACRFGQECKNEHIQNTGASASILTKKPEVDLATLIKAAAGDMLKAEKGNQWPLTCFGPYQAKPCFPGFEDTSFEEIRLGFYEAQKTGTLENYKVELTKILQEAQRKIKSLQNPSPEATNMLKEIYYYNGQNNQNVFGNSNNIFSNNQSVFSNPASTHTNSIFGGGTPNPPSSTFTFAIPENKIFGTAQPVASSTSLKTGNSIFANANQNFASNSQSIFGGVQQPTQNTNSIFGNPQASVSNQTSNIFANTQVSNAGFNQNPSNTIFGNQSNTLFSNTQVSNTPFGNTEVASNSPFSSTQNTTPFINTQITSNSTFIPQSSSNTPFVSSSNSIFANNQNTVINSPFGNVPPNNSPFVNPPSTTNTPFANQNTFGNTFQTPYANTSELPNDNPFLNAKLPTESPFQNAANTNSIFNTNPISHSANIFGNKPQKRDDSTIYSKLSELSSSDIVQYEKQCFDFGAIPTKAPALQMC